MNRFAIGLVAALLVTSGCTTAQKDKLTTGLATVCTSAPLAQALYNTALASHDNTAINNILNYLQASCPAVLVLIQTVPVKVEVPVAAPPPVYPVPGPERG